MNIKEAKSIAFGSRAAPSLEEFYGAWQWLYDNEIDLQEPDRIYIDKLICDGILTPRDGYFDDTIVKD